MIKIHSFKKIHEITCSELNVKIKTIITNLMFGKILILNPPGTFTTAFPNVYSVNIHVGFDFRDICLLQFIHTFRLMRTLS